VRAGLLVLVTALSGALHASLGAQNVDSITSARADEVLARVRRITSSDVSMARALADSLVQSLPPSSPVMAEALFAKASIAASAADAERDYSRIITEHRFATRVPDALMRLAVLESARNNRAGALKHLERLLRDHGDAPARARASLLAGRIRMDMNDPARACELLAAAFASATTLERDVRDQAVTAGARCPVPVETIAARDPAPMGVVRAPREQPIAATPGRPAARPAGVRRDSVPRVSPAVVAVQPPPPVRRDSVSAPSVPPATTAVAPPTPAVVTAPTPAVVTAPTPAVVTAPTPSVVAPPSPAVTLPVSSAVPPTPAPTQPTPTVTPSTPSVSQPTPTVAPPTPTVARADTVPTAAPAPRAVAPAVTHADPAPIASPTPRSADAAATPRPAPRPAEPTVAAGESRFAVQFAAYNDKPGAEQFAAVLRARGIAARVEGRSAPFRVRAGRYTTRTEAEAAAAVWRRPGTAAIVVPLVTPQP
jgi:SPOR domain